MRNIVLIPALGAMLLPVQALAQAQGNGGIIRGAGGTVSQPIRVTDRTVNAGHRAVNVSTGTMNRVITGPVRMATRADLRAGTEVRDSRGQRVGSVQSVQGDRAVVVQGNRAFHVPIATIYRGQTGVVTSATQAQLQANARVTVKAGKRD